MQYASHLSSYRMNCPFGERGLRQRAVSGNSTYPRCPSLLDHLSGTGEGQRLHSEAERLRSFEVDDQLEAGRLLNRKIGGLGALENIADQNAALVINRRGVRAIADQAAGCGEVMPCVYRWYGIA